MAAKEVTCLNCEKKVSDKAKHQKETGHGLYSDKGPSVDQVETKE